MKVFVVFAIFVVASNANLCEQSGATLDDAAAWKATISFFANQVVGHCDPNVADFNTIAFGEGSDCLALFNQGFCYGQLAAAHYVTESGVVNYGHLATDLPNIHSLAKSSCDHARGCFESMKAGALACIADDENFLSGAVDAIEGIYMEYGERIVAEFAADDSNSLLSELATLLRSSFTSVDDIQAAVDAYLTPEIVKDAKHAYSEFEMAAKKWCNKKCAGKSKKFLKQLFKHMNKEGGGCTDASAYCGDCQDRADEHLADNAVPCCLDNVIQQVVGGVDYIKSTYDGMIKDFERYLDASLSEAAVAQAKEIQARVEAQIACLNDSYNGSSNNCASEA